MNNYQKAAFDYAKLKHKGQKYGSHDYDYHLRKVYDIVTHYYSDEKLSIAAILHDVLEDTDTTFDYLVNRFGCDVACLVYAVTDEPGNNRKERKEKTYPKIKSNPYAIVIKIADRLANVRESKINNPELFLMYEREYPEFRNHLRIGVIGYHIWEELDRIFSYYR